MGIFGRHHWTVALFRTLLISIDAVCGGERTVLLYFVDAVRVRVFGVAETAQFAGLFGTRPEISGGLSGCGFSSARNLLVT